MKLSEVIAILEEYPNKKFKSDRYEAYVNDGLFEVIFNGRVTDFAVAIEREWEEVKEPVAFMEVIKVIKDKRKKDMRFTLEHSLINFNNLVQAFTHKTMRGILKILYQEFNDIQIALILTEGKWYIED